MQLVGATEGFIMKPFLKTFMVQGLIAAVIALILITITILGINDYLPEMNMEQGNEYIIAIYISVIILSLILTSLSTYFSMKKYINADLDKFYM
jgi:cell division transport system permease protein